MNLSLSKMKYLVAFVAILISNSFSQSTVTFNVTGANAVVGKEIFGLLMERLGRQWEGQGAIFCGTSSTIKNVNGMRQDIIDGFIEAGVGAAQWPGGCAANGYSWSANKNPSNAVGVDRFIQFCKLTGAEAVISLKPAAADAPSNLAFAQYIIKDLNYPLKWVKVGNEIWGGCGSNYTSGYTSSSFPTNVTSLKDLRSQENGKNLKIIAAAGASEGGYSWIPGYYTSLGTQMDAIEYHDYIYRTTYCSNNPTTANYWQIMNDIFVGDFHGHLYNNIVPAMKAADPTNRVKIDFDEWGDWLSADNWMQTITVMDAISAAGHLNQFVQNADIMGVACLAQGVNVIHSIMNINTDGVMVKTPAFYVFKMYKPHHYNGAKLCPMTASNFEKTNNVPIGNVAATVNDNDTVSLSFTNVDLTDSRKVNVTLTSSKGPYKIVSSEVVTGSQYTSTNPFGGAEQVNIQPLAASNVSVDGTTISVTLPAKSVVMVRVKPIADATLKSAANKIESAFSIRAGSNGTVLVSSTENQNSPVSISLYSADGKVLVENASAKLNVGSFCLANNLSKGAYLVKIAGANVNMKRLVIVANE